MVNQRITKCAYLAIPLCTGIGYEKTLVFMSGAATVLGVFWNLHGLSIMFSDVPGLHCEEREFRVYAENEVYEAVQQTLIGVTSLLHAKYQSFRADGTQPINFAIYEVKE